MIGLKHKRPVHVRRDMLGGERSQDRQTAPVDRLVLCHIVHTTGDEYAHASACHILFSWSRSVFTFLT